MDWKEEVRIKFAQHLLSLLNEYGHKHNVKPSLRQLAIRSGLEYSNVQRISKGKVDLALSSIISLAQGLEIKPSVLLDF